jgi:hypothetical protein
MTPKQQRKLDKRLDAIEDLLVKILDSLSEMKKKKPKTTSKDSK